MDKVQDWDLNLAIFRGTDGIVALIETLRRSGARDVEFGYKEEDADDMWPDRPITAYARARYPVTKGIFAGRNLAYREEVECKIGGEFDRPDIAINEALARIVRKLGGNVVMVVEGKGGKA